MYGKRDVEAVLADINTWYSVYGDHIQGICEWTPVL